MNHLPKKKNSCHLNHYGLLNVQPVHPFLATYRLMDAPTTPPYPPPRDSPTKGDEGEGGGFWLFEKEEDEQNKILEKFLVNIVH